MAYAPVYNGPFERVAVEQIGVGFGQQLLAVWVVSVPVWPLVEGEVDKMMPQVKEPSVPAYLHEYW